MLGNHHLDLWSQASNRNARKKCNGQRSTSGGNEAWARAGYYERWKQVRHTIARICAVGNIAAYVLLEGDDGKLRPRHLALVCMVQIEQMAEA